MKNKCKKLLCMGLAAFVAFTSMPELSVRAEIAMPEGVVAEQPAMEDMVAGTGAVTADGLEYKALENGTLEITKYTGSATEVIIPAAIEEKSVTSIGDKAFENCSAVTGITLPDSVTNIGEGAFAYCGALKSMKVPTGVTEIKDAVFFECSSLAKVELPNGLTSIGNYAFAACRELTSIELPQSVTSIGGSAFRECSKLTAIKVPAGVTSIGDYTFVNCKSLSDVELPDGLESIGDFAFVACDELTELEVPKSVTSIGDNSFKDCGKLTIECEEGSYAHDYVTEKNLPTAKQAIDKAVVALSMDKASYNGKAKTPAVVVVLAGKTLRAGTDYTVVYANNTNIGTASVIVTGTGSYTGTVTKTFTIYAKKGTAVTAGAYKYKFTSASEVAFTGIKSAKTTKVVIPKTVKIGGKNFKVTSIAKKALYKKSKVKSVTIGANVKTIGASAFQNCKKLSTITVKTTKLKNVGKNAFKGIKANARIKVPSKKLKAYKKLLQKKGQGSKVRIVK